MTNAYTPSQAEGLSPSDQALLARRERVLGPAYRLFYRRPLLNYRPQPVCAFSKGSSH